MIKFKVCLLGSFAVGKTSLIRQYVKGIFDEKYQTTLGVKIDKKTVTINDELLELILWDLAGDDEFITVQKSYLRGSAAVVLVADGTRSETLDIAIKLKEKVFSSIGEVPFVLLINKKDLFDSWTVDQKKVKQLKEDGWNLIYTSAREKASVESVFQNITLQILQKMST